MTRPVLAAIALALAAFAQGCCTLDGCCYRLGCCDLPVSCCQRVDGCGTGRVTGRQGVASTVDALEADPDVTPSANRKAVK